MTPFKSKCCTLPFTSMVTRMLLAFLLVSCAQGGDQQGHITNVSGEDNFSSPLPTQLQKLRPGLTAKVVVDKGSPAERTIDLQVDTQNDRVQGTIPDLPVGSHTFEIQYFIDGVLVATATVNANIQAGAATPVPFESSSFVFPDTDGDGASNLNEVEIFGSASNAWNDSATKPTVSVVLNPDKAILPPNGVQTFTAAIAQNANQGVTWSVEGGDPNGTITPSGTYTAPVTPGPYNVIATSQADPTKSATIAVEVVNPGTLDTAFDTDGIANTPSGSSIGFALAIQSDDKALLGGGPFLGSGNFTLTRYNTDGSPDTTFGTNGAVTTPIGTSSSTAFAIAVQGDGQILLGGVATFSSAGNFTLVRYNSNGTPDTSFGTNGIVNTLMTGASNATAFAIAIQGDGKIVLGGVATVSGTSNFALARYNPNGSPDTTFGTNGTVTTLIGTSAIGTALAIQSDGKIVLGGVATVSGASNFALARYNPNGTLDTSFGTNGTVTTANGSSFIKLSLAIRPNGKIVLGGVATVLGVSNFAVAQYNPNGSPDTTFGTNGTVTTLIGTSASGIGLAIQSDGKIVLGGVATVSGVSNFAVAQYNPNGSPDTTFGTNGTVTTLIGTSATGLALAIQSNGKIVLGGVATVGATNFALARYQTGSPSVRLRASLSGSEEVPPVTTTATGSATFVISPGQTEIAFTVSTSDLSVNTVTATHIHFASSDGSDPILFSLPSSGFVSPLSGKLTSANLGGIASVVPGVRATFADAVNAMRNGQTYIHIHTSTHLGGEIRSPILVAPPTLSSLQAQIFKPQCASCHIPAGPGAEETGLDLSTSSETSFNMLVNVPSTEDPTFKRVEPGNPDASYLVKKLEGTPPPRNTQMPLGFPPLSLEDIKKIRDWISAGAKND